MRWQIDRKAFFEFIAKTEKLSPGFMTQPGEPYLHGNVIGWILMNHADFAKKVPLEGEEQRRAIKALLEKEWAENVSN